MQAEVAALDQKKRESRRSDRHETCVALDRLCDAADGDAAAAFVIDERHCPDADATVMAAADELRQLGMAHEFKHVRIRTDEPARPLPSWTQYRQRLIDSDE